MQLTNLSSESTEYQKAREELRLAEIELMAHRERVADMRRRLPEGPVLPEYVFQEGHSDLEFSDEVVREVRLSDLFSGSGRALIVYHLMYGKKQTTPCPMCTMWIDGFDSIVRHVTQSADFAVVAASGLGPLREHARRRGWRTVRLLSAAESTFKYDLGSEDAEGAQDSRISVFTRDGDGAVRHFYTGAPRMSDDVDQRGIDLLCATWHLLDLTPEGRDDWYASLNYG